MVYGLGFAKEEDLTSFLDKFKEVKDLSQRQQHDNEDEQNSVISTTGSQSGSVSGGGGASQLPVLAQANGGGLGGSAALMHQPSQIRSISPATSSASSSSSPRPPLTPGSSSAGPGQAHHTHTPIPPTGMPSRGIPSCWCFVTLKNNLLTVLFKLLTCWQWLV